MMFWACRIVKDIRNANTREVIHPKGSFIALDYASGGYPYVVAHPMQMHRFLSEEDAAKYASSWKPNRQYKHEWEQLLAFELEAVLVSAIFSVIQGIPDL